MSDNPSKPEYVYIWGSGGIYKIGKAKNVKRRLAKLTPPPFPCELVHAIATDDAYKLEGLLHWHFRDKRLQGEWFDLNDEDIAHLQSVHSEEVFEGERQRQQTLMQQDPGIVELERYRTSLQAEIAALEARCARVQDEANERDRWWAMIVLRTREAEQILNQRSAELEKMEASIKQKRVSWWQQLWQRG